MMLQPAMQMRNMRYPQSWLYGCAKGVCAHADLSNDVDAIFISKNDRLYRPPYAREPNTTAYNNYIPYFICSVSTCISSALEHAQACKTICQGPNTAKQEILLAEQQESSKLS